MGFTCRKSLFMMLFTFLLFSGWRIRQVETVRPLHGWAEEMICVSPRFRCHHLSGGRCALNEMNVAGRVRLAPPTFPNFVIDVAMASIAKDSHAQDRSS
ncbi:hypothetical protein AAG906_024670 [Vitis piasezkii]